MGQKHCHAGHPNDVAVRRCTTCGSRDFFAVYVAPLDPKPGPITFGKAMYLGGLPGFAVELAGNMTFDRKSVRIDERRILNWDECEGLAIESEQVAKSKLGPALALGILGAVTAKGTKSQSYVTVRRRDKASAYFVISDINSHELRAKLSPLLNDIGVPILSDLNDAAPKTDYISGLERLAALRDSGHIDDEEFKMLKAELLANRI